MWFCYFEITAYILKVAINLFICFSVMYMLNASAKKCLFHHYIALIGTFLEIFRQEYNCTDFRAFHQNWHLPNGNWYKLCSKLQSYESLTLSWSAARDTAKSNSCSMMSRCLGLMSIWKTQQFNLTIYVVPKKLYFVSQKHDIVTKV